MSNPSEDWVGLPTWWDSKVKREADDHENYNVIEGRLVRKGSRRKRKIQAIIHQEVEYGTVAIPEYDPGDLTSEKLLEAKRALEESMKRETERMFDGMLPSWLMPITSISPAAAFVFRGSLSSMISSKESVVEAMDEAVRAAVERRKMREKTYEPSEVPDSLEAWCRSEDDAEG